jgi:pyroglutamyl-peptidase II
MARLPSRQHSVGAAEEKRIMQALGSTRERHLLERTLRMSIQPEWVRPQDRRTVLAGVASNPLGRELAWAFFRANFDQVCCAWMCC